MLTLSQNSMVTVVVDRGVGHMKVDGSKGSERPSGVVFSASSAGGQVWQSFWSWMGRDM